MNNTADQQTSKGENHVHWSRTHFCAPKNARISDIILDVTGFVKKVSLREANTANGSTKVAEITLDAYIGDRTVARYFREDFVREDHRVRFRATYWRYEAESIEKIGLKEGDYVQVMLKNMSIEEGMSKAGYMYKMVRADTCDSLYLLTRAKDKTYTDNGNGMKAQVADVQQDAERAVPNVTPTVAPLSTANAMVQNVCSNCGAAINERVAEFSKSKYGKFLCRRCQTINVSDLPRNDAQMPASCVCCGMAIDSKVAEYSNRIFGKLLCIKCQKTVKNKAQANTVASAGQRKEDTRFSELFEELDSLDESNPFDS